MAEVDGELTDTSSSSSEVDGELTDTSSSSDDDVTGMTEEEVREKEFLEMPPQWRSEYQEEDSDEEEEEFGSKIHGGTRKYLKTKHRLQSGSKYIHKFRKPEIREVQEENQEDSDNQEGDYGDEPEE